MSYQQENDEDDLFGENEQEQNVGKRQRSQAFEDDEAAEEDDVEEEDVDDGQLDNENFEYQNENDGRLQNQNEDQRYNYENLQENDDDENDGSGQRQVQVDGEVIREGSQEIEGENEEDRQFIDDADAQNDSDREDQQPEELMQHEEAEEDTGKKKRNKNQLSDDEIRRHVTGFISRMEFAWQQDREAFEQKKPAWQKLRMLSDLEEILANRQLHRPFLQGGILGSLKAWLELLPDFSMPNIKIRSTVFKILTLLPIDTSNEGDKNRLINSGIGRNIMFYYRCKDESLENRRMAKQLVEQFLRPIFVQDQYNPLDPEVGEKQKEAIGLRRLRAAQEMERFKDDQKELQIKPGQEGFRFHARIPQGAKLDYIKRPDSLGQQSAMAGPTGGGQNKHGSKHKLQNKIRKIGANGKNLQSVGAAKVSLSDKGIGT